MTKTRGPSSTITIRPADPGDEAAVRRLAALDSATVPASPLLVAEVDGELRAALSVTSGKGIADPFEWTAEIVAMLRAYAGGIELGEAPRRRRHGYRLGRLAFQY